MLAEKNMASQKRGNISQLILFLCLALQTLDVSASDDAIIPLPPVESIDTISLRRFAWLHSVILKT